MRRRLSAGLIVLVFGVMALVAAVGAQSGSNDSAAVKKYFGTWSGTWEGGSGNGGLDFTLEAGKDGKPGGHVSVTGEPTYKQTLKTLAFDGAKMTATYDLPGDSAVLVTLDGTFEGDAAKGTWSVKGGSIEPQSGTWSVKKK